MYERFSDNASKAMHLAHQIALDKKLFEVSPECLTLALLKIPCTAMLIWGDIKSVGDSIATLDRILDKEACPSAFCGKKPGTGTMDRLALSARTKKVIEYAKEEAKKLGDNFIGTEHLLLGLIADGENAFELAPNRKQVMGSQAMKKRIAELAPTKEQPKSEPQTPEEIKYYSWASNVYVGGGKDENSITCWGNDFSSHYVMQQIRERAKIQASNFVLFTSESTWHRAWLDLAYAADRLDAMMARIEIRYGRPDCKDSTSDKPLEVPVPGG